MGIGISLQHLGRNDCHTGRLEFSGCRSGRVGEFEELLKGQLLPLPKGFIQGCLPLGQLR